MLHFHVWQIKWITPRVVDLEEFPTVVCHFVQEMSQQLRLLCSGIQFE